ncbi:magnesium transporter CorA family protein [Pseudoroseicyclus tamaricis]|uniref:Magnesium transporter CorA family protein n=1 Tax=Pseudoroseicyclus tamaricis TaxID=2705421 RepID=A0A6B2JSF2_9RHOB|nr:magnesium transporter CorA family protein [Pseudoroseicyclus tamaricis]NDV00945.1 magnesium transporter CorA family protein [Pseudoroseicyclus tamaricis]
MLNAWSRDGVGLIRGADNAALQEALWIDLFCPEPEEVAAVEALGLPVPTHEDMEEIEISNRLYTQNGTEVMTAMLSGRMPDRSQVSGPVSFVLTEDRLLTVRYHAPQPFETFGPRAGQSSVGTESVEMLFLGLIEEIIARQADLLEAVGRVLDAVARDVYEDEEREEGDLREMLRELGRQGEAMSRVRLGLLSVERVLGFFLARRSTAKGHVKGAVKARQRDIDALEVHADFLASRLGLITDTTLGMIDLDQSATVRIVSVMSVIFLPPTLIASLYGMNFEFMPELDEPWGYPVAVAAMVGSAVLTWAFFRWQRML